MKRIGLLVAALLGTPVLVFAQANAAAQAASFVTTFNNVILYPTIALLSSVALLVFIYGCFEYIAMAGNDQAREKGVKHITWGIIGLVVMLSAYAILSIATATFGLQGNLNNARNGSVVVPIPAGGQPVGNTGGQPVGNTGGQPVGNTGP